MSTFFNPELVARANKFGFNVTDFAVFLPAVQANYAQAVDDEPLEGRTVPEGFSPQLLKFWQEGAQWQYPFLLNSIGGYTPLSNIDNGITNTSMNSRFALIDSGGFQIGQGSLGIPGLDTATTAEQAIEAWYAAGKIKFWMLAWMKTHGNMSVTIDMPLWTLTAKGKDSPFHNCSIEELTAMTVENLQLIQAFKGDSKFISVVQGLDAQTTSDWLDAISPYVFDGWSIAGGAGYRGGLEQTLRTTLSMRDRGLFAPGCNLLHYLGVSQTEWAVIFTRIQKHLRRVNPSLVVTFDSASTFITTGVSEKIVIPPLFTDSLAGWNFIEDPAPQEFHHVGSDEPFPYTNPFGDTLTLGHMNVYTEFYNKRRYDPLSLAILANINMYTYLRGFQEANLLVATNSPKVPDVLKRCLEVIDAVFEPDADWERILVANKKLLAQIKGNEYVDEHGQVKYLATAE